ncbi:unnamed protein product [Rotaria sordida]|uniref:Uncharacterized protein n=1 Tax=Rotaria sordida TaxID=392033 RepID=A0A814MNH4_9BILA|nr:unnamed protein product [Rotaria sordida]CAF1080492.1 unnamed protein product [Rotaria sordida]CAF1094102.1 unnamed protein product [Rotaria sordida]CAF1100065.1 unnamed protein product [Rotaria sordida]CAF3884117.1 unnamed protein product [Rotaria sordida]
MITKRVSFQRGKICKGYIGIPIPLDFFVHVKRTFSAVIFAVSADELLEIASQLFTLSGSPKNEGVIVTYLRLIFKILVIGFRRYPTLAAVYIDTAFSLMCASLYTWLDFSITIVDTGLCRNEFYPTDKNYNQTRGSQIIRFLKYYGTGSKLLFFQLLMDIPRYLFLSYITVKLFSLLIKRIRFRKIDNKRLPREQYNLLFSSLPNSVESRYVKNLLGMRNRNKSMNRFAKLFPFIYVWRDDFRFSSRIVSIYAAISLLLFFITVQALVRIPPVLIPLRSPIQWGVNVIVVQLLQDDPYLQTDKDKSSNFRLPHFYRPSNIGGIIYMCRLDYSPLGRKLETTDSGFRAYCGFINVECAHRHPILLCFISHLLRDHLYKKSSKHWSKARHKWILAVFLLNNPKLAILRKQYLNRSKQSEMQIDSIEIINETSLSTVHHQSGVDLQFELDKTVVKERF